MKLVWIFLVLIASLGSPVLPQHFEQAGGANDTLLLELRSGASIEIEEHAEPLIVIEASARSDSPAELAFSERVAKAIKRSGKTWVLESWIDDPEVGTSLHLSVKVPPGLTIQIQSAGGPITARGLSGRIEGKTGAGPIDLRNLNEAGVDLATGAGEIFLRESSASGVLKTLAGDVVLEDVAGEIIGLAPIGNVHRTRVSSSPGPPLSTKRPIEIERRSGNLEIDKIPAGGRLHTGSGNVLVQDAWGPLEVYSGSGHIRLGRSRGSLKVISRAGDITIGLARPPGLGAVPVTLRADNGSLTLELEDGLGYRITGHLLWSTRRSPPKIEAPFAVEATEVPWTQLSRVDGPRTDKALRILASSGNEQVEIDVAIAGNLTIKFLTDN